MVEAGVIEPSQFVVRYPHLFCRKKLNQLIDIYETIGIQESIYIAEFCGNLAENRENSFEMITRLDSKLKINGFLFRF
jgi:uncharacterized protein YfkK (UPF0435 family)